MVGVKRLVAVGGLAAVLVGLAGCPSQFLARIKEEIARYPFTATSYTFVRQWGNAHPEWTFVNPIVKTDSAGYIYVADSGFQIRKFSSAGVLQKTYELTTTLGLSGTVFDMAFDASGNMYVTTNDTNKIQKYDKSGIFLTSWGTSGGAANGQFNRASDQDGIAVDNSGYVYVVDRSNHRVQKFDNAGTWQANLGTGSAGTADGQFSYPEVVCVDKNNNVYVVDTGNDRVQRFTSGGVFSTKWGVSGTGGGGNFGNPVGIAVDSSATSIYVVDSYYINPTTSYIVQKFTNGTPPTFSTQYDGTAGGGGLFSSANSVALDTSGSIYVSDGGYNAGRVQKFDSSGSFLAGWGGAPGSADGVVGNPGGIVIDSSENSYIVDTLNSRIEKFDSSGNYASLQWGGTGTPPGPGQFHFDGPPTIGRNSVGNIYVPDSYSSTLARIQVFSPEGVYLNQWGTYGIGDKQFKSPTGVAIDSADNIYVADAGNTRIQVLAPDGTFLRKWGASGSGDGQFAGIYGIAVDSAANVYVSDMFNHRIQKFDSLGNLLLKWGTQGSADGQFQSPVGVGVDKYDNIYVADMGNRRIQKFDSSGTFLGKWGSIGSGNGGFAWVVGVAVNAQGHVLTTDWFGNLVQEFEPALP